MYRNWPYVGTAIDTAGRHWIHGTVRSVHGTRGQGGDGGPPPGENARDAVGQHGHQVLCSALQYSKVK